MGRAVQRKALNGYPFPSSAAVSAAMRGNRKRDTGPELKLRSLLHRRGPALPRQSRARRPRPAGPADIVFVSRRVAVFVDGCFWHSCRWHGTRPRVNTHYWLPKLARVKARDRKVRRLLTRAGWTVLRLWEHVPPERSADLIRRAVVVR